MSRRLFEIAVSSIIVSLAAVAGLSQDLHREALSRVSSGNSAENPTKSEAPYISTPDKIGPQLRRMVLLGQPLHVLIVLTEQPQRRIFEEQRLAAQTPVEAAEANYRELLANGPPSAEVAIRAASDTLEALESQLRRTAFARIDLAVAPSQQQMEATITQLGGATLAKYQAINMIAARVPASVLDQLASLPAVAEIYPVERQYAQLLTSVPALGTSAFWDAGFTGTGQSVATLDTGVRTDHPAFAGLAFNNQIFLDTGSLDTCFADNTSSFQDQNGHGTHVAGIVASRGATDCLNCRGVAKGLGTLYNLKIGFNLSTPPPCNGGGASTNLDVEAAIGWLAQNAPVKILNYSYGSSTTEDDSAFARAIDQLVDSYGLFMAVAAGNDGPGAATVTSPGTAYNITSVANWSTRGTVYSNSSRGPTAGGRNKPDIAAPGTSILSTAYNWDSPSTNDFVVRTGTSMAAPHIAGAAALIAQAGVSDPLAIKSILLNTTDNTGWASDRGWGYANLTNARSQLFYRIGYLTPKPAAGSYQLYSVPAPGTLLATTTWNRHVVGGSTSAFNDIDLYAYTRASNAPLSSSVTSMNNVEQVFASSVEDVVVKVKMFSSALGGGIASEKFAVAFSKGNVATMSGPSLNLTCSPSSANVVPSAPVVVTCNATNTGDLPAFGVTGSLTLPAGFSGSSSFAFGTLQPLATGTASLNLSAPLSTGSFNFTGNVASTSYEESSQATTSFSLAVMAVPGPATSPSPADGATGVAIPASLSWTPGNGATSHDVYFGAATIPPFATNTTGLAFSPSSLTGGTTYYWRLVARNGAGTTSSPTWSFTTANPTYSIGGQVTKLGVALAGVTMTLSGGPGGTQTTDAAGAYAFANLPAGGNYTVTPSLANHSFTPVNTTVNNLQANQTATFTAVLNQFTISGNAGIAGATVTLSGTQAATVTADAAGAYSFANLPAGGNYTVTPSLANHSFTPVSTTVNNLQANQTATFTAVLNQFTISGNAGIAGATVTLSGTQAATVTADAAGAYAFANLPAGGNYTVTPSLANHSFTPVSTTVNNLQANQTATFTAVLNQFTISGNAGIAGATVTLSGTQAATVTADAAGAYAFANLPAGGNYTISPALPGYSFTPSSRSFPALSANQSADFVQTRLPVSLSLDRTQFAFAARSATLLTPPQTVILSYSGAGTTTWTASTNQPWLQVTPASGSGRTRLTVSLVPASLPTVGVSNATVTISAPNATPTTYTLNVVLTRLAASTAPFGAFDTPGNNATGVSGSIAVSGWALDDIFVSKVELFRDPVGAEPTRSNGLVYIADALFVPNARPDVESANPTLPFAYRAGWGYLMLTTGIPNAAGPQGNGAMRIWAFATDVEGNTTNLGSKTITLDNAHSRKPFGAIDTPGQGGTASGSSFINFGWALTPLPNIISLQPTKIWISLDGTYIANVNYGQFRSDIATGFPGYRNSGSAGNGGAGGYFILDTTKYTNGMHNIGWFVVDDVNNQDGIGSRFFFIENGVSGSVANPAPPPLADGPDSAIIRSVRTRPQRSAVPQMITAQELQRLVIPLPFGQWTGGEMTNGELRELPVGSTLDNSYGAFYWQLGPGLLGRHELLFKSTDGAVHGVTVNIEPATFAPRGE